MPSKDHELFVLITNLHGTGRLSADSFERLKLFLINPLFQPVADDATEWITVGNTMLQERQYTLALKCYANAIEIDPSNLDAWNNISITFETIGRYEEALRCRERMTHISVAHQRKKVTK